MFADVDAFVSDPALRRENDLDEKQLRAAAVTGHEMLIRLVKDID